MAKKKVTQAQIDRWSEKARRMVLHQQKLLDAALDRAVFLDSLADERRGLHSGEVSHDKQMTVGKRAHEEQRQPQGDVESSAFPACVCAEQESPTIEKKPGNVSP